MIQEIEHEVHKEIAAQCLCPYCRNPQVYSMEELSELVSKPSFLFSADLAEWLTPPQRPVLELSRRHRTGLRNGVAFGVVCIIVFTVAYFALTGAAPSLAFATLTLVLATITGFRSWRTERALAASEDKLRLDSHRERYWAYIQRRQVWSRLRYCSKCAVVVDPVTMGKTSLFEVHELANNGLAGVGSR
ncbi:hypothetical protein [Fimbriimonas ginsengisoli]|uniref:Uncharacterized protein n=1 Tax=Fimbriimonas ginsengisoli Gsoil 348 TaxID=661478 RepID=A0A068NSZ9_FIMGI|nr:hypothetical protein [Fimbriimonas ginsengisoli]AIE86658.1 hypothetical protein OP10G_3290 [Fimbriimonas ginsengisoli Gsoil 348]